MLVKYITFSCIGDGIDKWVTQYYIDYKVSTSSSWPRYNSDVPTESIWVKSYINHTIKYTSQQSVLLCHIYNKMCQHSCNWLLFIKISANHDAESLAIKRIEHPFVAEDIRILPSTSTAHNNGALRIDIKGCEYGTFDGNLLYNSCRDYIIYILHP